MSDTRGPEEAQMVSFGYFVQMAATQWKNHPAAAVLKDGGYDVEAELWAISRWCYGEGRERAIRLDSPHSDRP